MGEVSCEGRSAREINAEIKQQIRRGETHVVVRNPGARHNLGVAILDPVNVRFEGSVGYYCGGLIDGPKFEIAGSAGWGLAESMMSGQVVVRGSAGNGAAAALRGGTVVIHGDAAARLGVSMKGGTVLVAGNCGYMAGFMMQKGRIVICGDAGDALADSMYEGVVFVGGKIESLGNDAVIEEPSPEDRAALKELLSTYDVPAPAAFRKVVSGRKLWNFDKKELDLWKVAL